MFRSSPPGVTPKRPPSRALHRNVRIRCDPPAWWASAVPLEPPQGSGRARAVVGETKTLKIWPSWPSKLWENHRKTRGKWWFHGSWWDLPYGKLWHKYGISPFSMGKLTMAIFNCRAEKTIATFVRHFKRDWAWGMRKDWIPTKMCKRMEEMRMFI